MFWTLVALAGLATVFVKLGAYSVWITIYSLGFKLGMFVLISLAVWSVFRRAFSHHGEK